MSFAEQVSRINVEGSEARVELSFSGSFPTASIFNQDDDLIGETTFLVEENNSVVRQHTHDTCSALLVNSSGWQVTMGDGEPVVTHNGNPVTLTE